MLAWQGHMTHVLASAPHQQLVPELASAPVCALLLPDHRTLLAGRCKKWTGNLWTAFRRQTLTVHVGVFVWPGEGDVLTDLNMWPLCVCVPC